MNLASLQHLVRSAYTLAGDCQVIVLGSASLLASFPELGDGSEPLAVIIITSSQAFQQAFGATTS